MSLDRLWQLDVASPASNSNYMSATIQEGATPPSAVNNALRNLGSMVKRETAYNAGAISASVSTNLVTSTSGFYMQVAHAAAGNPNISSFGTVPNEFPDAAVLRIVEFSCSASLSHGPALRLVGGASRRTQPGDIGAYLHVGSSDSWIEALYSRATPSDGQFSSLSASLANATTLNAGSISATAISNITFMATKGGSSQTSISSTVVVTFSTEDWDIGGFFASSAWTPPVGKYRLTASLRLSGINKSAVSDEFVLANLRKGGAVHRRWAISRETSNSTATAVLTTLVDASGSDAFDITIGVGSDPPITVLGTATDTWFCGERI